MTEQKPAESVKSILHRCLSRGIPSPLPPLSSAPKSSDVPHAPRRTPKLTAKEFEQAIANALRYFPSDLHDELAPEFAKELQEEGHIYMRRLRPTEYAMRAYPLDHYPAKCRQAAAIMLMIQNNLDPAVAQYPEELITYGGNGSVLSNWAQYHLIMYYLSQMTEHQTLTMYSGHPMGLFPSHPGAPRMVISNGMVIPNYSSKAMYDKMYAMGNTIYGQMTAGSYCYIGPQGIVHGTTITILNAGRKYLNVEQLKGKVYVSSGLGGMSGAQGKAGAICGAVTVIAEVDYSALKKRYDQGWVTELCTDVKKCIERIKVARQAKATVAIAFHGNIVELWEALADHADNTGEMLVDLGSDQTSLHNPFGGGYYPVQLSFEKGRELLAADPAQFRQMVQESLKRHVAAINRLTAKGMRFWDYGNSFLLQASKAGADVMDSSGIGFRYPSYVQEFMGDVFSLGFGPFRWVCTSGAHEDLQLSDKLAADVIRRLKDHPDTPPRVRAQYGDNLLWIEQAEKNQLVVGSEARILYADAQGRMEIAQAFNDAIKQGKMKAGVVLSRDHHDVSGTDSPYRETSNVTDGSMFCADMAVQNVIGDSFRGATWVALHNGGGVGWGEVTNGGFGMFLDGSKAASERAASMLFWDVNNGVARRAWAGNDNAQFAIKRAVAANPNFQVTVAYHASPSVVTKAAAAAGHASASSTEKRPAHGGDATHSAKKLKT